MRSCAEVFNRTITPAVIVRGQAGRLFGKGPLQISCQEFVLQACRVINDDSLRRDRTKVRGVQAVQMAMMDWRLEQVAHSKVYLSLDCILLGWKQRSDKRPAKDGG